MSSERNYGIDFLRFILMYMVCMLHTLGQGGILDSTLPGSVDYKIFWLLEIFSYCAVDGFVLISGYMANPKPRKYEKLVEMWFQVFFYSFIVSLILSLVGINNNWGAMDIIIAALPVTSQKFWFFNAYFCLFLSTPLLNRFLFAIDEKTAQKVFILIFFMFSITGIVADPFITNRGLSAIWFIVLYCLGVLAKKIRLFETRRSISLIILWLLCVFCTWFVYTNFEFEYINLKKYVSPTILLSAVIIVILFSRIKLKGTIISKLSPLVFGIYLLQNNEVIWDKILKDAFVFVVKKPLPIGIFLVFIIALGIFTSGLIVEFLRTIIFKLLRISGLSKKIVLLCDALLGKVSVLLK